MIPSLFNKRKEKKMHTDFRVRETFLEAFVEIGS